jgi:hypothetical protein
MSLNSRIIMSILRALSGVYFGWHAQKTFMVLNFQEN